MIVEILNISRGSGRYQLFRRNTGIFFCFFVVASIFIFLLYFFLRLVLNKRKVKTDLCISKTVLSCTFVPPGFRTLCFTAYRCQIHRSPISSLDSVILKKWSKPAFALSVLTVLKVILHFCLVKSLLYSVQVQRFTAPYLYRKKKESVSSTSESMKQVEGSDYFGNVYYFNLSPFVHPPSLPL